MGRNALGTGWNRMRVTVSADAAVRLCLRGWQVTLTRVLGRQAQLRPCTSRSEARREPGHRIQPVEMAEPIKRRAGPRTPESGRGRGASDRTNALIERAHGALALGRKRQLDAFGI
jgi:hypothetical protein